MNKKKILYSTLLVLLIGIVLFFYDAFNGNPLSNYLGKNVVEGFLVETYPDENFRVEDGQYDFTLGEYEYPVIKIGEDPYASKEVHSINYSVSVSRFLRQGVKYDSIRCARIDDNLSIKLREESSAEITNLIKDKVFNIIEVGVTMEVLRNQLPSDTSWSPDLELDTPIQIYIVTDVKGQDVEDVINNSKTIQKLLNENDYDYSEVTIRANGFGKDLNGEYNQVYEKYSLSFNRDKEITIKDVKEINKK